MQLPLEGDELDARRYDDERGEVGGFGSGAHGKVAIVQQINHDGEVNRARCAFARGCQGLGFTV